MRREDQSCFLTTKCFEWLNGRGVETGYENFEFTSNLDHCCAYIDGFTGFWETIACSEKIDYICQRKAAG